MSISRLKNHKFLIASVIVMFVFYLWMACQIPYTHDDWDWGLNIGLNHLLTADINNRFSGNFIEVVITRSVIAKSLVMAFVFTFIPFVATLFASKVIYLNESDHADLFSAGVFGAANILILFIPVDVWQQTNGWIAGFSNFVVSGLSLVLFFFILARSASSEVGKKGYVFRVILYVLFGILSQLFLENLTVFFFIFAVVFVILKWKNKTARKELIPLIAGLLIGAVIMFSNNIYSSLIHTGYAIGTYRQMMYDPSKPFYVFIADSAKRFFGEFVPQIVTHQGITVGSISLVMTLIMLKKVKNKLAVYCLGLVNVVFSLYYMATSLAAILLGLGMIEGSLMTTVIDCACIILIAAETVLAFKNEKKLMTWLLALWFSPYLMMAPMLLINTVGPRCYYTTNLCLIVFGITVLGYLLSRNKEKQSMVCLAVLAAILVGSLVRWVFVYKPIGDASRARARQIEEAVANGDKKIVFAEYPNSEYLWIPDPDGSEPERIIWFQAFYNIPSDIEVEFESWLNQ